MKATNFCKCLAHFLLLAAAFLLPGPPAQSVYYRIADPRFVQAANLIREALSKRFRESAADASAGVPRRKAAKVLLPA